MLNADADRAPVSLELFDLGELHNRIADVAQALGRQVGARDVLDKGGQVDTRVLLGETIRS